MPMAPPPITSTRHSCSGRTSTRIDRLIACQAVAAGSVSAAATAGMSCGIAIRLAAGMLMYSA